MMKIAIDALGTSQVGGTRSATLNLLTALFQLDQENEYLLFVDGEEPVMRASNVQQHVVNVRGRFTARLWAQLALPVALRRARVDLVHYLKNLGAFFTPGKMVVTVHDLSVLLCPDIYPLSDRLYWRLIEPLTLRQANRVIAVSADTARDIVKFYGIPAQRITVIHNAYGPEFRPLTDEWVQAVRDKYSLPPSFILHVGSVSRKKNLLPVVKALARLKEQGQLVNLVLVGRLYGKAHDEELFRYMQGEDVSSQVMWLGEVPDQDLPSLYNAAAALVFPSLQEGFGIAALEAMACGLPVLTSGAGAIVEVVGEAGLVVGAPGGATEWAAALEQVLRDDRLRVRMRALGLDRARLFSRQASAERLLQVYRELAGESVGAG